MLCFLLEGLRFLEPASIPYRGSDQVAASERGQLRSYPAGPVDQSWPSVQSSRDMNSNSNSNGQLQPRHFSPASNYPIQPLRPPPVHTPTSRGCNYLCSYPHDQPQPIRSGRQQQPQILQSEDVIGSRRVPFSSIPCRRGYVKRNGGRCVGMDPAHDFCNSSLQGGGKDEKLFI